MKKWGVILLLSLAPFTASAAGEVPRAAVPVPAAAAFRFSLYLFNPEFRYERSSDLDLGFQSITGFGLGGRWKNFAILLETAVTTYKSGNQALSIDREHRDFLLSGRYFFWNRSFQTLPKNEVGFYGTGGAGFYTETVRTSLMGTTTQDNGNREALAAAGLGVEANLGLGSAVALVMGAEVRILAAKSFDPNPEPSGIFRLGLSF